jgi:hypothetical protein
MCSPQMEMFYTVGLSADMIKSVNAYACFLNEAKYDQHSHTMWGWWSVKLFCPVSFVDNLEYVKYMQTTKTH